MKLRRTITFEENIHLKIQKWRGNRFLKGATPTYTDAVNYLIKKGLK